MATRTVTSRITGRVQGVGFRVWVQREASRRGVCGWVRNRADGSVETFFTGEEEAVTDLMLQCYVGPAGSRVTEMVTDPAKGEADGFEILPTE